jgi:type I restriction enzyme S subunit
MEEHSRGGTMDIINLELLSSLRVPLPPLPEQRAIAAYLDLKTIRLDAVVAATERLIALLQEKRAAQISRAVTRGLEPNVLIKRSGIDWLRDIPAHWEVVRCKSLFQEVDDRTNTGEETLLSLRMNEGLVPHNEVSDKPITPVQLIGYRRIKRGQLVMNRMRAASGLFAVANTSGLVSPDYAVFDSAAEASPDYYAHLFKTPAMQAVFRANSKGLGTGSSGFLRLYSDRFGEIPVPRPPLIDQERISNFITEESRRIDVTISTVNREIALIEEYRAALISAAVTGKIDVRDQGAVRE